jgi:hypothetical protein
VTADPGLGVPAGAATWASVSSRTPDVARSTIVGRRAWSLRRTPDGALELAPVFKTAAVWPALEPIREACFGKDAATPAPHVSPGEDMCGVYAALRPDQLHREAKVVTAATAVIGSVSMWGTVVEHAWGYRAELAYPGSLRSTCAGCPYFYRDAEPELVTRLEGGRLAPVCDEHAPRASPTMSVAPATFHSSIRR